jgi:putative membrane protein
MLRREKMKTIFLCGAFASLAMTAATAAEAPRSMVPQTEPMAPAQMQMPRDTMGYARMAGAGDLYEIESSRLAQQKGATGAVRQFGQMMIEQHTQTTQALTSAARAAGMTPPPPALAPRQQKMIDELRGLSGAPVDAAYLRQQRMAHQEALALHAGYAENGDNAALRKVAAAAVPIVQRHIDLLAQLPKG